MPDIRQRADDAPPDMPATVVPGIRYGVLDQLVGYPVRRAQLLIYDDFIRSLVRWGLTPSRFSALVIIANNPGLKLTELSGVLAIARSGSVLLADTLEAAGLIERRALPTDRRAWGLHLTRAGRSTLEAASAAVAEHEERMVSVLSADERAVLKNLLRKLARIDHAVPPPGQKL